MTLTKETAAANVAEIVEIFSRMMSDIHQADSKIKDIFADDIKLTIDTRRKEKPDDVFKELHSVSDKAKEGKEFIVETYGFILEGSENIIITGKSKWCGITYLLTLALGLKDGNLTVKNLMLVQPKD